MTTETRPIEHDLLKDAATADIHVTEAKKEAIPGADGIVMRISGRLGDDDAQDVEWAAHAFLYAVAALSFDAARPAGNSGVDYVAGDRWTVRDLFEHLRFVRGELQLYADYVRGRRMKTTITVRADGMFLVETLDRGDAAALWLKTLKVSAPRRDDADTLN